MPFSTLDNLVDINGTDYYEFMFDLGEPASDKRSLLSLDTIPGLFQQLGHRVPGKPVSHHTYLLDGHRRRQSCPARLQLVRRW